ncbi:restriction endonuclease [Sphingobium sp.]|uniref:restriction endonuclease n=1 Tax=Sphingobium sp. TaxID=1912891 RepID=UPI002C342EAE|nr:restriction endonuclease [Sphingobium sp.]HUD93671.1 restriction endonuclease [Sphingobium sp.]
MLEGFQRRNLKVIRNHRYSGHGGIDGHVIIDGAQWLIHAKRYEGAIWTDHVVALDMLCQSRVCRGLLVHVGRTGPQSRKAVSRSCAVRSFPGPRCSLCRPKKRY